jgi:REP element-mobilizing transposase RayT
VATFLKRDEEVIGWDKGRWDKGKVGQGDVGQGDVSLVPFYQECYRGCEVISMSRSARRKSEFGIYHVMVRGINQVQIFYDGEDREAFLDRLARYKEECQFCLYAYALMGNHVHLLIKEQEIGLAVIMKKLALSYSHCFNMKYQRRGYLFEGRYRSEPVETDEYLLTVLKYIHDNPRRAGLPAYGNTSHAEYLGKPQLVDTAFVLEMLAQGRQDAKAAYVEFMSREDVMEQSAIDRETPMRISDDDAISLITTVSGLHSPSALCEVKRTERDRVLGVLMVRGLSVRQLARLTGISRSVVQRARC